jgi:hypothetical protein
VSSVDTPLKQNVADQIRMAGDPSAKVLWNGFTLPQVSTAHDSSALGLLLGAKTPDQVLADMDAACAKAR